MKKCSTCANANAFTGYHDGNTYLECGITPDMSKMSAEELRDRCLNPSKYANECQYKEGTPKDCGVTFDD